MRAYKFLNEHFGLKSLSERRLKISTLADLNDPFELLPYEMSDRNRRRALRETRDELARRRGMLCFSADWIDPVIWAHYSDKHRGLCLGFEIPDEQCKKIQYVSKRLTLPAFPTLHAQFLHQFAFAGDAVQIADQQNAQQELGINRGATGLAVVVSQSLAHKLKTDVLLDQPQQMVLGNLIFQAEVVEHS
jgi:hypothetical protein